MIPKTYKINPLSADQKAGRTSNDVEIKIGRVWFTASSVYTTLSGVLKWKSDYFIGNSPEGTWRWVI